MIDEDFTPTREFVLNNAHVLISEDRAVQYGDAYDTHRRIAEMWNAIMPPVVKAHDVALFMVCVKCVRAMRNPRYIDSYVDIAGYAALAAELAESE